MFVLQRLRSIAIFESSSKVVPSWLRYVIGEDVAPSHATGSTLSWPSFRTRVEGVDGVGRMML